MADSLKHKIYVFLAKNLIRLCIVLIGFALFALINYLMKVLVNETYGWLVIK